jgi:hypothetical protein
LASFLCEHTAEYMLVPRMQAVLATRFPSSVPIYFWKTREGNSVSSSLHSRQSLRVLAMFARRPKIVETEHLLGGKINQELYEFAGASWRAGIPAIAAFPAVSSLWGLYDNPPVFWISLQIKKLSDMEFILDTSKHSCQLFRRDGHVVRVLSDNEIIEMINQEAKVFEWDEAMKKIGELRLERYREGSFSRFFRFGGYKPVYFLLPENV